MDIAHPDVDGVAKHLIEVTEATMFLANNIPHGMAFLTEAMQVRASYEQRGETIPMTELVGPWKRWAEEEATRVQAETSKVDTNTEPVRKDKSHSDSNSNRNSNKDSESSI
jgi:hypothetical protein